MHECGQLFRSGDWDRGIEVVRRAARLDHRPRRIRGSARARIHWRASLAYRGDFAAARQALADSGGSETSPDVQSRRPGRPPRRRWPPPRGTLPRACGSRESRTSSARSRVGPPRRGAGHHAATRTTGSRSARRSTPAAVGLGRARRMPAACVHRGCEATRAPGCERDSASATRTPSSARRSRSSVGSASLGSWPPMLEGHGHSLEARGRDGSAQLGEARRSTCGVGATPAIAAHRRAIAATDGPLGVKSPPAARTCYIRRMRAIALLVFDLGLVPVVIVAVDRARALIRRLWGDGSDGDGGRRPLAPAADRRGRPQRPARLAATARRLRPTPAAQPQPLLGFGLLALTLGVQHLGAHGADPRHHFELARDSCSTCACWRREWRTPRPSPAPRFAPGCGRPSPWRRWGSPARGRPAAHGRSAAGGRSRASAWVSWPPGLLPVLELEGLVRLEVGEARCPPPA